MGIMMIGRIEGRNPGFRMLDTSKLEVRDIDISTITNVLRSANSKYIENMEYVNGEIRGTNGSIDRYGIVDKKQVPVILEEVLNENSEVIGYTISDSNGTVKRFSAGYVIKIATQYGVANGKVVTREGKTIISSIRGSYKVTYMNTNSNKGKENKVISNNEVKSNVTTEKRYPYTGNLEKAVLKIEAMRACDVDGVDEAIRKVKAQKYANEEQATKIYNQYMMLSNSSNCDYLRFEKMSNGNMYVAGIKEGMREKNIVIPEAYMGIMVTGIKPYAFQYDNELASVRMPSTINDIGYGAFYNCTSLEILDMSLCKNEHIPKMLCYNCQDLFNVKVGNCVKKIHEKAFYNCREIRKISLRNSVEKIAASAFERCTKLECVEEADGVKRVGERAFENCRKLEYWAFKSINYIGTSSFKSCGFIKVDLPNTVNTISRRAFMENKELIELNMAEGIQDIGSEAFSGCEHAVIKTAKSIVNMGEACFGSVSIGEVKKVLVYHGSIAESTCIGYGVRYAYLDDINNENATTARIRSEKMGMDIMRNLYTKLMSTEALPDIELDRSKFIDMTMSRELAKVLGVDYVEECDYKDNKFNAIVNYITASTDIYLRPVQKSIIRFMDTMYREAKKVYSNGVASIYEERFTTVDNLEEGRFILITIGNKIVYMARKCQATDMCVSREEFRGSIAVGMLHAGDIIGRSGAIVGKEIATISKGEKSLFGAKLLDGLLNNGIIIRETKNTYHIVLPYEKKVLKVFIKDVEKHRYLTNGDKRPTSVGILDIIDIDKFCKDILEKSKATNEYDKYFNNLNDSSDFYSEYRKQSLSVVSEETVSDLYVIAKKIRDTVGYDNVEVRDVIEKAVTPSIFREIANTYWLIEKDYDWFSRIGKKSLNKVGEYQLEGYTVSDYISNQIVRFNNAYMSGGKGAHVIEMKKGSIHTGVYASMYSFEEIVKLLLKITSYKVVEAEGVPELMKDPSNFDSVRSSLFFRFYDMLYSKNGWEYKSGRRTSYSNEVAEYGISMYKPTGIFYITMNLVIVEKTSKGEIRRESRTYPLLPIGDMDRALIVAATTNSAKRDMKLCQELIDVVAYVEEKEVQRKGVAKPYIIDKYIEARRLAIAGETDIEKYKSLINDRIAYMLGVIPNGEIKVYNSATSTIKDTSANFEIYDDEDSSEEEYIDFGDTEESIEEGDYDIEESDESDEVTYESDEDTDEYEFDLDEYDDEDEDGDIDADEYREKIEEALRAMEDNK